MAAGQQSLLRSIGVRAAATLLATGPFATAPFATALFTATLFAAALFTAAGCDKPQADAGQPASATVAKLAGSTAAVSPSSKSSSAAVAVAPAKAGQLPPEVWSEGEGADEVKWTAHYQVYPALNVAMGSQNPGSIDAMVVDMAAGSKVVLVEVSAQGKLADGLHFTTALTGPGGKTEKRWKPAHANKKGPFRALISAPADTNAGRTRLVKP